MEDRCVMCGKVIPEGSQVCSMCVSRASCLKKTEIAEAGSCSDEFSFAEWLENQLRETGMSQTELANAVGITKQMISGYVCGVKTPSFMTATDILNLFHKKFAVVDK